jgi:polyisoprenyl-teichoic acid--peptidoglycan teichoic acid transferase
MVSTDIPRDEVDRFVELALKARSQKIATLSLVPPMIDTAHPDIALVQQKVAEAIARAEGRTPVADTAEAAPDTSVDTGSEAPATEEPAADGGTASAPAAPTPPATQRPVTGGSIGSLSQGYAANQSEDLGAVC